MENQSLAPLHDCLTAQLDSVSDVMFSLFEPKLCGLVNCGATCYINATFQQIFRIPVCRDRLEREGSSPPKLQALVRELTSSQVCNPRRFLAEWIGWEDRPIDMGVQRDVTEFLDGLLRALPFEDLFRIRLTEWKVTSAIRRITGTVTSFFLAVDIQGAGQLTDCLERFVESELLRSIYCTIAHQKVTGTVATTIDSLPPILIIKLNRFDYCGGHSQKLNTKLEFPDELDLTGFTSDGADHHYELDGAILHRGTLEHGHYICVKRFGNKFVKFDDQLVSEIDRLEFERLSFGGCGDRHFSAYCLFYIDKSIGQAPTLATLTAEQEVTIKTLSHPSVVAMFLSFGNLGITRDLFFRFYCRSRMTELGSEFQEAFARLRTLLPVLRFMNRNGETRALAAFQYSDNVHVIECLANVLKILNQNCPARLAGVFNGVIQILVDGLATTKPEALHYVGLVLVAALESRTATRQPCAGVG
jgi:hypothetical protein